jgi:serine/threonine protein kinase
MDICPYCAAALPTAALTCPNCGANLESPALGAGTLLHGKYRLEHVLGQGGFGITYLALDTSLEHRVAIKELFPEGSTRRGSSVTPPPGLDFSETKAKFLDEARVVQRFDHPNIVRVYGTFLENDTAYIVMEALEGQSLQAYVSEYGAMPEDDVIHLVSQLCSALERVHAAGLLHRDVKPDNVLLASDGRAVLLDFGSARAFTHGQERKVTRMVTPGFAPLEQYATQARFGTYTDVYGLAATVYFALEGVAPPTALDRMNGAALPAPKTAVGFTAALEAGLALQIAQRTQTVTAFRQSLEESPVIGERLKNLAAATAQFIFALADIEVHGDRVVTPTGVCYFRDFDGYYIDNGTAFRAQMKNDFTGGLILASGAIVLFGVVLSAIIPGNPWSYSPILLGFFLLFSLATQAPEMATVKIWKLGLTRASSNQPQAEQFALTEVDLEADRDALEAHLAKFLPRVT